MSTDRTCAFATWAFCLLYHAVCSLSCYCQSLSLEFPTARSKVSAAQLLRLQQPLVKQSGNLPQGQPFASTLCCISLSTALISTLLQKLWSMSNF